MDWEKAKDNLSKAKSWREELKYTSIQLWFDLADIQQLELKFDRGVRTEELYLKMMAWK